ncbi:MAG: RHS repeat-associated core domain-containing protein, partial [Bacteroidota bacterium]
MFNRFERTASISQNYKFQAMEWLPELRWYDFGPRGYDPFIVRTNSLDLLADQFPDMSPYSFLNNNPLRFTDPSGMAAEDIIEEDCCNGASGVGEGIARAAQSKVNQV